MADPNDTNSNPEVCNAKDCEQAEECPWSASNPDDTSDKDKE